MTAKIPHGLEGYRRWKCRCTVCKAANAEYSRDRRAAKAAGPVDNVRPLRGRSRPRRAPAPPPSAPTVPTVPTEPEGPGMVELGVIAVCENSPVAADRPDLVATARRLALVMDNPEAQKDYASAARGLDRVMTQLCPAVKAKSKGRLVAIQKMTNRVSAPPPVSRDA